ncbi:hypothetical protein M422DRAFT_39614 [Sphaerobolus stellatus SS14]|uniref:AB hydrolase-1 domain-containing protein n=1 Tax=Sphaerobolus stellatus (strain SS14) TaxID=990650 RepID=A0A0C9UE67_SPHS4|nr:hypothetical protein M422DRAFT_39614 [Sphaerobolus stellatus SS14]
MPIQSFAVHPSKVFRTPEERFADLPGFPYIPRYGFLESLRYAFIDETSGILHNGRELSAEEAKKVPSDQIHWETFLCLHGQPTWSYLYRRMIPVFLNHSTAGNNKYIRRRVLAPDYFGCGRSDKPIDDDFYTFDMHQSFLIHFVRRHILEEGPRSGDVTMLLQGGILGFTLVPIFPELFTRLLVMNTALGLGKAPSKGWNEFHDFIKRSPDVNVGNIIARGTTHLTPKEIAAYDAPHPNMQSKSSVRRFPPLVPRTRDMPGVPSSFAALGYISRLLPSQLRVFVAIGLKDPVLGEPVMEELTKIAFSSVGSFVLKHPEAGHFVQEWGAPIAQKALDAWSVPQGQEDKVQIEGVEWRAVKAAAAKL